MLTRNHRQEALTKAYVRAIAAHAGLTVSEPENDYGIDMTLRAITLRGKRRRDVGPQVDLQLKSTAQSAVRDTHLAYDLAVANYDDLRAHSPLSPRLLIVLVLPADEARWLSQSDDELVLRHCAYWLSLAGYPETAAKHTVRVSIPMTNVFSVPALRDLIQRLNEGKDP